MTAGDVNEMLARIAARLELDRETEREILAEIRTHLEEAVAAAQARGLDESTALAQAAARFGLEEVGEHLQQIHAGRATADAVLLAALPVLCALVLRWLAFAPDGTATGWPELLIRPAFWTVALAVLVIPWLTFRRRRYAVATWAFFWAITVLFVLWPASRW